MINTALNTTSNSDKGSKIRHRWARKTVFSILEKIEKGSLTLTENGQVFHFGEDSQSAQICGSISIKHPDAYLALLQNGEVGAGEGYMQGLWESADLVQLVQLIVSNLAILDSIDKKPPLWRQLLGKIYHLCNINTRKGSKKNIAEHYDLSNEFFSLFLDNTMAYSAGIYHSENNSLAQASINKFQHVCEQLQLKKSDHLLEIGSGWGGLAIYAAKHYGCKVTTITLSKQQYVYAKDLIAKEGLAEQISIKEMDYRELDGKYDKLVSIEMIEAVGPQFYNEYFRRCSTLLKPDGLMLIQAITISDQRYQASTKKTDFIKSYIFPGGQLPSNSVICSNIAQHTDMQLIGMRDITMDYALTLKAWRSNFWDSIDEVKSMGFSETFIKMWNYYLCFCEGSFKERVIHTGQFLMAKPDYRQVS